MHIMQEGFIFDNLFINELRNVHDKIDLIGFYKRFLYIHQDIVLDEDSAVTLLYIYIKINRPLYEELCSGMAGVNHDCLMDVSLKNAGKWYSPKSVLRGEGGIVGQFRKALLKLDDMGFITLNNKDIKNNVYGKESFEIKGIKEDNLGEIDSRNNKISYATIYLDEIERLFEIKRNEEKYGYKRLDIGNLFRIFLYIKMNIRVRSGKMKKAKPIDYPEVYYDFYCNIADKLNINRNTLKKYIELLCKAKLLYKKHIRLKIDVNDNGEECIFETIRTVFCNPYVRIKNEVVRGGEKYCEDEVDRGFCKVINKYKEGKQLHLKKSKAEGTLWKDDKSIENIKTIVINKDTSNIAALFGIEDVA